MPRNVSAKARLKLTTAELVGFAPPPRVDIVWDTDLPGFGLRTRDKADLQDWRWVYVYRHKSGRKVTLTGNSPRVHTPEQARKWAKLQAKLANTSDDPYEAKEKAKAVLKAERSRITVAELWKKWRAAEGALKKSAAGDLALWNNHIRERFGSRKVAELTQLDFANLRDSMSAQPIVANRALSLLSRMFTKAVEWGYRAACAPEHPVKGVNRNPENAVEFWFSDEDLGRILEAADADNGFGKGLAIRMLANTGARLGEVMAARWGQLTALEDGRLLWVVPSSSTKNNKPVARVLSLELTAKLEKWRPISLGLQASDKTDDDAPKWIFPSADDPKIHMGRKIWAAWERIKKRAGVKRGRIHDLRHTVGTVLTEETGSLEAAFHQLGHATMLTTRRYAHLTPKARGQTSDILTARLKKAEDKVKHAGGDA